jgi:enamine deaminase RidA (YjgF/YER057c/UK114 family)/catechol 2,3-dioxygenase-like lactoylglutathione lyase family enzyme
MRGQLHHIELYVASLNESLRFWQPLLSALGYVEFQRWPAGASYSADGTYIVFVEAEPQYVQRGYPRKGIGLNHLAFHARSRGQVDELTAWMKSSGHAVLYEDRHPYAGGPGHYALYCEDPNRIKVEVVAPPDASDAHTKGELVHSDVDQRLKSLGLELPELTPPRGNFKPYVIAASMLYISGKGSPLRSGKGPVPKVGAEITVQEAQAHAREVGLYLLAVIKEALGGFSRLKRVLKVYGMVNAVPDFTRHTEVINGCSDLLVEVLGERGEHARSAVGVGSLPMGFAVEIEAIVEIE